MLHSTIAQYLRHRSVVVAVLTLSTERAILQRWAGQMGGRELRQIGQVTIEDWMLSIRHLAPSTQRARFTVVRSFFDWCVTKKLIPRSPMIGIAAPKVPRGRHRALSRDEAAALLDACSDPRDHLIIMLGLQAGARRGEIAALRLEDINWSTAMIRLTGKGGHARDVPIADELMEALDAYLRDRPASHGPLVRGDLKPFDPVQPVWVGRLVTRIAKRAGVKRAPWDGVGTHSLRHTAGTDVARESNGNAVAVRDFLGHANIATSEIYIAGDPERLRSAVDGRRYRRAS